MLKVPKQHPCPQAGQRNGENVHIPADSFTEIGHPPAGDAAGRLGEKADKRQNSDQDQHDPYDINPTLWGDP